MKLYSLQMEIKLQLYEITFSHLQQRTQKFESQRNPLTQSINKETPLRCNLRASYRSACFCLKNRIQIAQRTQTVDSSEWVTIFQAVTQDIIKSRKQAPVRKKKKKEKLPLLSHHFQVKNEAFFCNQTLKHIFWTTMWVSCSTL